MRAAPLPVLLALTTLACGPPPTRLTGFAVVPRQIPLRGGTVTVAWSTQSANRVVLLAGELAVPLGAQGSVELPLFGTTNVRLVVDGEQGHATRSALVTANLPTTDGLEGQLVDPRWDAGVGAGAQVWVDGLPVRVQRGGAFSADAGATWDLRVALPGPGGVEHLQVLGAHARAAVIPLSPPERDTHTATVALRADYEGPDGDPALTFTIARLRGTPDLSGGLVLGRDAHLSTSATVWWQGPAQAHGTVLALRALSTPTSQEYFGASDPLRFTLDAGATITLPPLAIEPIFSVGRTVEVVSAVATPAYQLALEAQVDGQPFDVVPPFPVGLHTGIALPIVPHVPMVAAVSTTAVEPGRTRTAVPTGFGDPIFVPVYPAPQLGLEADAGVSDGDALAPTVSHPQACELTFTPHGAPAPARRVWTARPFTFGDLQPPLEPGPWTVQARCFPEQATVDGLVEPANAVRVARTEGRLAQAWSAPVTVQYAPDAGAR